MRQKNFEALVETVGCFIDKLRNIADSFQVFGKICRETYENIPHKENVFQGECTPHALLQPKKFDIKFIDFR